MNIVFDFDGTLFKTETVDVYAFNKALAELGRQEADNSKLFSVIGQPLPQIARVLINSREPSLVRRFCAYARQFEIEIIPEKAQMYPYALELLLKLKNLGHTVCLCSNGTKEYIHAILDRMYIRDIFRIVWYKKHGYSKERALREIKKRLKNNEKTIYIGDRLSDINAAKRNGLISIGVLHGFGNREELKDADYIVKDLKEAMRLVLKLEKP